jgi:hypothetical protein
MTGPEKTKAPAMPGHDRFGLDDGQRQLNGWFAGLPIVSVNFQWGVLTGLADLALLFLVRIIVRWSWFHWRAALRLENPAPLDNQ